MPLLEQMPDSLSDVGMRGVQAEKPCFFPPHPPGIDDVVAFQMRPDEVGDRLRRVLQVPVHQDDRVPGDVVERRGKRGLVAEVPGKSDDREARLGGRRTDQCLSGSIPAPVVDKDDLMRAARDSVQHHSQAAEQLRQQLDLVVDRHGYGKADAGHHCHLIEDGCL